MADQQLNKPEHAKVSRMACLLLNRAMMYGATHPQIQEGIEGLHQNLARLLPTLSSLTLILNQGQMFLDEERVDPRINTNRIVAIFKKTGIQSISFLNGITAEELQSFIDVFTTPDKYPDSDAMTDGLDQRGVQFLKINHIFYKKVSKDDEVVSRDTARLRASLLPDGADQEFKKRFMEMLLESVLTEEADQALSMKSLMANPTGFSQNMLDADNKSRQALANGTAPGGTGTGPAGDGSPGGATPPPDIEPGAALLYQIQTLSADVQKSLDEDEPIDMMEITDAVFEMKRQLITGIETQKALNVAYANEAQILDQVNELTDSVLVKLIKDEYRQGEITTARLAQIIRRLMPEADELKRLLPKIKSALLAEGMPLNEYLNLVRHLGKELDNEGLSRILQEAAESVGVDGEELIAEIRKNPDQAAELLAIAAETRKGGGDENAFTEMLVNYVEQLGDTMRSEAMADGDAEKARQAMADIGSGLAAQLRRMNFSGDQLSKIEERINARIEDVFEKRVAELAPHISPPPPAPSASKSLFQMMEQSRGEDEELQHILKSLRTEVETGALDENNFEAIYTRIIKQVSALKEQEASRQMPTGVLKSAELKFQLEKELHRAKRHNVHVSTLAFTIINVRPQGKVPPDTKIKKTDLLHAAYQRLVEIVRVSDIIGELKADTMTVILPMANKEDARLALKRITKLLHETPLELNGVTLSVLIAGSVSSFKPEEKPNLEVYIKTMVYELDHVKARVKHIHGLG